MNKLTIVAITTLVLVVGCGKQEDESSLAAAQAAPVVAQPAVKQTNLLNDQVKGSCWWTRTDGKWVLTQHFCAAGQTCAGGPKHEGKDGAGAQSACYDRKGDVFAKFPAVQKIELDKGPDKKCLRIEQSLNAKGEPAPGKFTCSETLCSIKNTSGNGFTVNPQFWLPISSTPAKLTCTDLKLPAPATSTDAKSQ